MADLANLVSRLEAVTLRLEKCGAGGAGGASAADDDDDYGNYIYVTHQLPIFTIKTQTVLFNLLNYLKVSKYL